MTLAEGASSHESYFASTVHADIGADGLLSVVYQARAEKRGKYGWFEVGGPQRPYYLIRSDGTNCLSSSEVTGFSADRALFDVAVDEAGRTHVVWVEDDETDAVMKHRWFR